MMRLFTTPASSFVRKVTVTIRELGIGDRVELVPTRWPHSWGTHTVPFRPDFADATPVGRIPALVTDDGLRLTDSSVICEFLNAEYGDYRLCPAQGQDRCYRVLDGMATDFPADPDLGQIALGAACGISDFRFSDVWRPLYPRLARWYDAFRKRPSMRATEPAETPTTPDDPHAVAL